MILETDHKSRPVLITIFARGVCLSVRPHLSLLFCKTKQLSRETSNGYWWNVGLAERVIHDTHVLYFLIPSVVILQCTFGMAVQYPMDFVNAYNSSDIVVNRPNEYSLSVYYIHEIHWLPVLHKSYMNIYYYSNDPLELTHNTLNILYSSSFLSFVVTNSFRNFYIHACDCLYDVISLL